MSILKEIQQCEATIGLLGDRGLDELSRDQAIGLLGARRKLLGLELAQLKIDMEHYYSDPAHGEPPFDFDELLAEIKAIGED